MTPQPEEPADPHCPEPLTGWRRSAARMPIHLFRSGLGPLFRGRLLLLVHTGRLSGEPRRTALEVVEAGRHAEGGRVWTVASGFGPRADWYRNLRQTPQAVVQAGRGYHAVSAHFLPSGEGGELMARYAPRHPRAARKLCAYMGFTVDGSEEGYRRAGAAIPFVQLTEDAGPRAGARVRS